MRLSKNFTLKEFTRTGTGLENNPDEGEIDNIFYFVKYIAQPLRDKWGRIDVGSGFRSKAVNEKIGGHPESQHLDGQAGDLGFPGAGADLVFLWLRNNMIFGQAILSKYDGKEYIHISLPRIGRENGAMMVYDGKKYEIIHPGER